MKLQSSSKLGSINFSSNRPHGTVPAGPQGSSDAPKNCPVPCTAVSSVAPVNGQIFLPQGKNFFLDKNIDAGMLQIQGNLYCVDNKNYEIKVETIFVSGKFICGTFESPYSEKLNILLKENNNKPITGLELQEKTRIKLGRDYTDDEFKAESTRTVYFRAIVVAGAGSVLQLTSVNKAKMSRLAQDVNPGDTSIKVNIESYPITNWSVGNEIAFSPIGGDYQEEKRIAHESVRIKSIRGNTITLESSLKNKYYGNFIELYQGSKNNYTLDMSNELINLSRNIKIQPFDPRGLLSPEQEISDPGGHVMVHD